MAAAAEDLHLSQTWAALLLKLVSELQEGAAGQGAAAVGLQAYHLKDQLSPAAPAVLLGCMMAAHAGAGAGLPDAAWVASWLDGTAQLAPEPTFMALGGLLAAARQWSGGSSRRWGTPGA